ncbi:uncharacterized protein LOC124922542 [Impatiens glandulifera]|uniref:uncharacterized protein LOC124922542 n=1 Tax=Impatiens glandulifera TaxID=253017 RepID=UPI001FB117B0|nr:uncharacterized protein LOC124922542 [Impatiens glandulifera]
MVHCFGDKREIRMGDWYEEFQEGGIWAALSPKEPNNRLLSNVSGKEYLSVIPRQLPAAARMIPKAEPKHEEHPKQQSAPVCIPVGWSKMEKAPPRCHGDDDDYEAGDVMIPPHEWIALNLAKSKISSFSVCEGAGRTLKGRDLANVRNAVLTKTGFLEL